MDVQAIGLNRLYDSLRMKINYLKPMSRVGWQRLIEQVLQGFSLLLLWLALLQYGVSLLLTIALTQELLIPAFQSKQLSLLAWWSVCIWTNTCYSK
jgi:hypothetical protein